MPFKPVGANENGLFPARVMVALSALFVSKTDLGGQKIARVTQAQYAALTGKDGLTNYVITDWGGSSSGGTGSPVTLAVTANGQNAIGWANEGTPVYTAVATDDGASSAIYSPTVNDLVTYQLADMPVGAVSVASVTVVTSVFKIDPVSATTRAVVVVGTTVYEGPDASPVANTAYERLTNVWTTNPATGAAWTIAEVNALEIGIKKTNTAGERCSYIAAVVAYA